MAKPTRKQRREGKVRPRTLPAEREVSQVASVPLAEKRQAKPEPRAETTPLPDPPTPLRKGPDMKWVFLILAAGAALYVLVSYLSKPPAPAAGPVSTATGRPVTTTRPAQNDTIEIPIEPLEPSLRAPTPSPEAPSTGPRPEPSTPAPSAAPPPPPTATAKAIPPPAPKPTAPKPAQVEAKPAQVEAKPAQAAPPPTQPASTDPYE